MARSKKTAAKRATPRKQAAVPRDAIELLKADHRFSGSHSSWQPERVSSFRRVDRNAVTSHFIKVRSSK